MFQDVTIMNMGHKWNMNKKIPADGHDSGTVNETQSYKIKYTYVPM